VGVVDVLPLLVDVPVLTPPPPPPPQAVKNAISNEAAANLRAGLDFMGVSGRSGLGVSERLQWPRSGGYRF
jgi:hypothetical protein